MQEPMPKPTQLKFFKNPALHYGGKSVAGKRRRQRPFDPKRPLHLSLKAAGARGERSMLRPEAKFRIFAASRKWESRAGVRLMGFENVGNHLHLVVLARKRRDLQKFLRGFTGQVAMLMTGAKKGQKGKFWTELAWSRVVNWGRDLLGIGDYLSRNLLEALGVDRRTGIPLRAFPLGMNSQGAHFQRAFPRPVPT
jgi:hypothetical protein